LPFAGSAAGTQAPRVVVPGAPAAHATPAHTTPTPAPATPAPAPVTPAPAAVTPAPAAEAPKA
jgi:hypothetical protein